MIDFFSSDYALAPMNVPAVILGLLLAFIGGQTIAWVYMHTHSGLSYSRSFVSSLLVIPVVVALVMMVLSNNLVTAFGLMAVFAIVRFRNILRDTLDTTYVLAVIVIGMACGTMKFATAVLGAGLLVLIFAYIWFSSFGTRNRYDIIVNLHWSRSPGELGELRALLDRHSLKTICASQRAHDGATGMDFSYRLLLRDPRRMDDLLAELRSLQGVSRVTGLKADEQSEI
ncbi:MAG TPA: DUF4956 domain-containing protein [Verrucomicrobia bacterium]|nr:DUF4956 domain-containing protein [Verrucomicrobiota bacterium]HOB33795.1 DUF4956 domain-containing protein [Verrucomicrobiota bacterium]HOP98414.1 DUF4956 domain-containing protein [Verrucomicrobiota bacterium]